VHDLAIAWRSMAWHAKPSRAHRALSTRAEVRENHFASGRCVGRDGEIGGDDITSRREVELSQRWQLHVPRWQARKEDSLSALVEARPVYGGRGTRAGIGRWCRLPRRRVYGPGTNVHIHTHWVSSIGSICIGHPCEPPIRRRRIGSPPACCKSHKKSSAQSPAVGLESVEPGPGKLAADLGNRPRRDVHGRLAPTRAAVFRPVGRKRFGSIARRLLAYGVVAVLSGPPRRTSLGTTV
jgi:hypothetical protein